MFMFSKSIKQDYKLVQHNFILKFKPGSFLNGVSKSLVVYLKYFQLYEIFNDDENIGDVPAV